MMLRHPILLLLSCLLALATACSRPTPESVSGTDSLQEIRMAAADFLTLLDPEQQSRALFPFESEERFNFNYIPTEREGPYTGLRILGAEEDAGRARTR